MAAYTDYLSIIVCRYGVVVGDSKTKNLKSYVPVAISTCMAGNQPSPSWQYAIEQMRERGPITQDEIRYKYMTDLRQYGVHSLQLKTAPPTQEYGQQTPVYYLVDEHAKEEVVRRYVQANPVLVDGKSRRQFVSMFKKGGPEFKRAAQTVADEYELETDAEGGYTADGRDCPYCGETVELLPNHLRHHCSDV